MTAPAEDPRGGECHEVLCTTTRRHHVHADADGRHWCCGPYPYTHPAAGRGGTDSGGEAIEPGLSAEANARRLKWFTDAELVAELTRRRALDGA